MIENPNNAESIREKIFKYGSVAFKIFNLFRLGLYAVIYYFMAILGSLVYIDSSYAISPERMTQYTIAVGWLIVCFLSDAFISLSKSNSLDFLKVSRMLPLTLPIFWLIIFFPPSAKIIPTLSSLTLNDWIGGLSETISNLLRIN